MPSDKQQVGERGRQHLKKCRLQRKESENSERGQQGRLRVKMLKARTAGVDVGRKSEQPL